MRLWQEDPQLPCGQRPWGVGLEGPGPQGSLRFLTVPPASPGPRLLFLPRLLGLLPVPDVCPRDLRSYMSHISQDAESRDLSVPLHMHRSRCTPDLTMWSVTYVPGSPDSASLGCCHLFPNCQALSSGPPPTSQGGMAAVLTRDCRMAWLVAFMQESSGKEHSPSQ